MFNPEYGDFDKMFSVLSYNQLEQLAKSALDELIHRAYTDGYENGSNDVIENFKKIEKLKGKNKIHKVYDKESGCLVFRGTIVECLEYLDSKMGSQDFEHLSFGD